MDRMLVIASKFISLVAGFALTFMMFLTFSDVILRAVGMPIIGTYEMVSLLLALVVAMGLPQVTAERGHVYMEFVIERLGEKGKKILNTATRLCAIFLFLIAGVYLLEVGRVYKAAKEVTATIRIPFYPFAYIVAICAFVQCAILIREMIFIWRRKDE
ncbi:MAG: TRAP transporter small permease [Deltaproteobacteria bacterium]|nr:TRAP transporter small permease [Deltaproteobacteria bacterium]